MGSGKKRGVNFFLSLERVVETYSGGNFFGERGYVISRRVQVFKPSGHISNGHSLRRKNFILVCVSKIGQY